MTLKEARKRSGLTQAALAEAVGVPIRTIKAYEQGNRDIDKAAAGTVLRIAKACGCTMEDLLE